MNRTRIYFIYLSLTVMALLICGCANLRPSERVGGSGVIESESTCEVQKSWDDMSLGEKVGSCLWWPLQWAALWGGSALNGHGM
jgi:hypothetical protein